MAIPPSRNVGDAGHTTDHNSITAELTAQAALIAGKAESSHAHAGTDISSGTVPAARLGSGSSITTKYLRGDNTWQTISTDLIDHTHAATDLVSGFVSTARLGSGSASSATFLRGDGEWATPTSTSAPGAPTLLIAAGNSTSKVRARADVVCDGTNDAAQINDAIVAATNQITTNTAAVRYGSITLADGVYVLNGPILIPARGFTLAGSGYGTVLMKAASFTDAGRGTPDALIKMANTTVSNGAGQIQIRDLHIWGTARTGAYGSGNATGSPVGGIYLEITGDNNDYDTYGLPIGGPDPSDNWSSITRVRCHAVTSGIHWTSTDGMRGVSVTDCAAHNLEDGGSALHVNASDARIIGWKSGSGGAANATGIKAAGGNTVLVGCKTSFFNNSGGVGMDISSSRCMLVGCEAQDNNIGIRSSAVHTVISGGRVDNQVAGMTTGLDLTGATTFMVSGIQVQTRGSGAYTNGINLPDSSTWGFIDAMVDPGGSITRPLAKDGTNITTSGGIPTNMEARVLVVGTGTLRGDQS